MTFIKRFLRRIGLLAMAQLTTPAIDRTVPTNSQGKPIYLSRELGPDYISWGNYSIRLRKPYRMPLK